MRLLKIACILLIVMPVAFGLSASSASASGLCPDATIDQYLQQPVEKTLGNTKVIYAAEVNFRRLAAQSDRPMMLLFYNNDQDFSKGLAAVATCVINRYPQVRFIAYEIPELTQRELDRAGRYTGGTIQTVPSLYLYRYTKDGMELAGSIQEGYRDKDLVKKQIVRVDEFVKTELLH
ncbi:hypothetical protein [Pseudodesulfovibrio sp.]|uniref:hypothetical protein n=1 Tax=Pseudodesulfovibrio sp. TaxID=2035812 RepID=UPI00261D19F8|nr:hypothetical protein [Pseudodesulfovibrio sp.]MDD3312509.1 hypothetical protein [Pseudodesulfovibrio sp.]